MNRLLLTALLGAAGLGTPAALAQTAPPTQTAPALTPQAALTRLATVRDRCWPTWFTADFASALPQIRGAFQGFKQQYGTFSGVDDLGNQTYRLRYASGNVTVTATLNAAGQLSSLFLKGQQASAAPAPVSTATPTTTAAALTRLASASTIDASWFTPEFAGTLPQIRGGFQGFASQYGAFQGVDSAGGDTYTLRYAGGTVTVTAQINAQGQLTSLFLKGQQATASAPNPAPQNPTPQNPAPQASSPTPQAALSRLLGASSPSAEWFTADFLAAVPLTQLGSILNQARSGLGAFQEVTPGPDGSFTARFAQGVLPIKSASLDAQGRFTGLLLGAGVPDQKPDLTTAVAAFGSLPGQNSVVVLENGKQVGAFNPQSKLAVGSTFKLGILAELQAQIGAGLHRWDEVKALQPGDKSLPSGFVQSWPDDAPLTLQTLASLMISQSDNTATDMLLRIVGRDGVAKRLGLTVLPSTREFFALKNPANAALKSAYLAGDDTQKKTVLLNAAAAPLPAASLFAGGAVVSPQIEWFVSVQTLCSLMSEVAALPLTRINPGPADPGLFKSVSYKGGSEGGVLNLTTQVTTRDGRTLCISATSNDSQAIDETRFASAYGQLLQAVR